MRTRAQRDAETFRNRTGVDWIDSRTVTNCAECQTKFTVINRKHHCRQCGQVICKKCSPERVVIGAQKVRICLSCYDDISIRVGCPSASLSSTDCLTVTCFICRETSIDKLSSMVEGRIKGQDLIYWHPTCLKCVTCHKSLKFHETYLYPIVGNPENQQPQCYCEGHVPKVTPLSLPIDEIHLKLPDQTVATNSPSSPSSPTSSNIPAAHTKSSTTQPPTSPQNSFQPRKFCYGPFTNTQYFLLHIPREKIDKRKLLEPRRSVPLVVILHGGFWKSKYSISNSCVDNLPKFFLSAGIATCVVEYRRVAAEHPDDEGGWPETGDDILLALEALHSEIIRLNEEAENYSLPLMEGSPTASQVAATRSTIIDLNRIVLLGHSAGGQLALWACSDPQLSRLHFKPLMCVGIAPVADLIKGQELRLSDEGDAIEKFMKMPYDSQNPVSVKAYRSACPSKLLPLLVPTILVTGTNDTDVPFRLVEDFYWYAKRVSGEMMSVRAISRSSGEPLSPPSLSPLSPQNRNQDSIGFTNIELEPAFEQISGDSQIHHLDSKIIDAFKAAPPPLKLLKLQGSNHYDVMDSSSSAWSSIFDEMTSMSPQLSDIPEIDLENIEYQIHVSDDLEEKPKEQVNDNLRSPQSRSGSLSMRLSPTNNVNQTENSPLVPIKAVDYIWVCHVKSLNSTNLKGPNYHNLHETDDDDLLSDTSSEDNNQSQSKSGSKSRPNSGNLKMKSSRDSTASRDNNQTPQTSEQPSEFYSFPTPTNDRKTKSRFKFLF